MTIKNYTTTIDPSKTAGEIVTVLTKNGAQRISMDYSDDGSLRGLSFALRTEYGPREFALPVRVDGVHRALQKHRTLPPSKKTREQAARVAWRVAKEWLEVQVSLIEAGLASLDEVMTPWMLNAAGDTMYEVMRESGMRALTEGSADA